MVWTNSKDRVVQGPSMLVVFQYGSDMSNWTSAAVGAASGTVGSATITQAEEGIVADAIIVTVPRTEAVGGKLFALIKIVKAGLAGANDRLFFSQTSPRNVGKVLFGSFW